MVLILGSLSLVVLLVTAGVNRDKIMEWYKNWTLTAEELLAQTRWERWNVAEKGDSVLADSVKAYEGSLTIRSTDIDRRFMQLEILRDTESILTIKLQRDTPFVVLRDLTLVYVDYPRMSFGGEVVAQSLRTGRELWRTPLKAMGKTSHSRYTNRIWVRQDHPRYLTVFGNESQGSYTEDRG